MEVVEDVVVLRGAQTPKLFRVYLVTHTPRLGLLIQSLFVFGTVELGSLVAVVLTDLIARATVRLVRHEADAPAARAEVGCRSSTSTERSRDRANSRCEGVRSRD